MSKEIMRQALDALEDCYPFLHSDEVVNIRLKAIEALESELAKPTNEFNPDWDQIKPYHDRIAELEAQLAQPEQEPVAWQVMVENEPMKEFSIKEMAHDWAVAEKRRGSQYSYWIRPLYTAPPKRDVSLTDEGKTWQGLTDEELDLIYKQHHNEYGQGVTGQYERAIEAKLKEKNT